MQKIGMTGVDGKGTGTGRSARTGCQRRLRGARRRPRYVELVSRVVNATLPLMLDPRNGKNGGGTEGCWQVPAELHEL